MIAALIKPALPWIAGAALAGVLALGAAWQVRSWQLASARAEAAALRQERDAARAEVAARNAVVRALEAQAAAAAELAARLEPIRRAIHAAPPSNACAASPAVRAGLDRLRAGRAAAGAGAVPRAQPPGLPGGAAGD
jgi:hypothetical protein